jgi:hypothetical protein
MEGTFTFDGMIKNKDASIGIFSRRNTKDSGIAAFWASDAKSVAIKKLMDGASC